MLPSRARRRLLRIADVWSLGAAPASRLGCLSPLNGALSLAIFAVLTPTISYPRSSLTRSTAPIGRSPAVQRFRADHVLSGAPVSPVKPEPFRLSNFHYRNRNVDLFVISITEI